MTHKKYVATRKRIRVSGDLPSVRGSDAIRYKCIKRQEGDTPGTPPLLNLSSRRALPDSLSVEIPLSPEFPVILPRPETPILPGLRTDTPNTYIGEDSPRPSGFSSPLQPGTPGTYGNVDMSPEAEGPPPMVRTESLLPVQQSPPGGGGAGWTAEQEAQCLRLLTTFSSPSADEELQRLLAEFGHST